MGDPINRYSRQILFPGIGDEGQKKISASRVVIVGCGALGTVSAGTLGRAGVGHLILIDRDFIEESNLQRQILFDEEDIKAGLPKAEAARRRLQEINSTIKVDAEITDVNHTNVIRLIQGANLVIDATDNFETRFLINEACVQENIPWIYGACIGSTGLTMNIIPGKTPCLRCLYETAPPPEMSPSCDTAGIIAPIVSIIASLQAAEALKMLTGNLSKLNHDLIHIDVWEDTFNRYKIGRTPYPKCPTCAEKRFDYLAAKEGSHTTSLCGRNAVQITRKDKLVVNLSELAVKLEKLGKVSHNKFMLKFEYNGNGFTVFPDGRAIIQGTHNPTVARNLYSKYIGA